MNADIQKKLNKSCWFQFVFQTILYAFCFVTYLKVFGGRGSSPYSWNEIINFLPIAIPFGMIICIGIIMRNGFLRGESDLYDLFFQTYKIDKKKIFILILTITLICCLLFAIAIFFTKKYKHEISWNDFYVCVICSFLLGIAYYLRIGLYPLFPKERKKIKEIVTQKK